MILSSAPCCPHAGVCRDSRILWEPQGVSALNPRVPVASLHQGQPLESGFMLRAWDSELPLQPGLLWGIKARRSLAGQAHCSEQVAVCLMSSLPCGSAGQI